ncbi:uncharacterized protein zgc:66455 [Etheostoma spectabile]|uniref:uncharacterized protein zgc:66455 n=1 Tax=Etheostoma spectabile TaxID=54343 RepID=UPI0013AF463D|nr:uncharacterized protein LOC116689874 [Etheostoma spectabile]
MLSYAPGTSVQPFRAPLHPPACLYVASFLPPGGGGSPSVLTQSSLPPPPVRTSWCPTTLGVATPRHEPRDNGSAFFALRSCQQLLQSDAGEFFSPDYLCSNPPLWCNWTIQVDPAKRIHLHLEDLTPSDACHLKEDQVHLDEPVGHLNAHKVLQKCWREAKYTSLSNIVYVVQLIGGWPSSPYRGFHGRYQAFGPPVVYNPQEGLPHRKSKPSPGILDFNELVNGEQEESEHSSPTSSDLTYDYFSQSSDGGDPEEAADPEADENHHPVSENWYTAVPASTQGSFRSGRGATKTSSRHSDSAVSPASSQQQGGGPRPRGAGSPAANVAEARLSEEEARLSERLSEEEERLSEETRLSERLSEEEERLSERLSEEEERLSEEARLSERLSEEEERLLSERLSERLSEEEARLSEEEISNRLPFPSEAAEPAQTEPTLSHPNMVEPLSDHRGHVNVRNRSEVPHLPGGEYRTDDDQLHRNVKDRLFEVTVEVTFLPGVKESWHNVFLSLLRSVKHLISKQLRRLHTPLSMNTKRLKSGHVNSNLHGLAGAAVGAGQWDAAISSVSVADVNECGTQMVLCDINADCVNRFGSYSCRCRPGFRDESRLGSGGTACVDEAAAGCGSAQSPEAKGVYVLFFLLSSLLLLLLAAAALLYHRHRHGAFLLGCHGNGSINNNNNNHNNHHHSRHHHNHRHQHDDDDAYSSPPDSDLPPPPPPARSFREGWLPAKERPPTLDLQLLRFSQLLLPDAYAEPQEGGKK